MRVCANTCAGVTTQVTMMPIEIASLRWEDVDGDELLLRAENSKNGEDRVIPFEGELAGVIERRRAARSQLVHPIVDID